SAARFAPSSLTTYFEVPVEPDPSPLIEAISEVGARAKVRTGGVTADAFPSSISLARFICACADAGVPFKATAGLHHPIRSTYRLTYDPASPTGMMFGFLNVFIAAGVALAGGHPNDVVAALEEQSPSAFHFDGNEITWRGHRIGLLQIGSVRSELAIAFGSCSFVEPLEDLKSLKLL
ncbi:MAG: hypothetical protein AAB393_07400, partial [Bacteroidota bacterium]